ncbi:hypothetical protein [Thermospira aquatica]|uniref:DUF5723 domain-containing protein n=1 Tax=Thermospira aquatica TaxID=2828656 RepID=A0AAX3BAY5_9SPIR|nr:hypothetical protein [Thermospira aquatica]URA09364.1 hypothetical protein KDW03_07665 [Thermospira aquatica]
MLISLSLFYGWRSWHFTDLGAEASGVGSAIAAHPASPTTMDSQPASIGLPFRTTITWNLSTSLTLRDPLSGSYNLQPDPIPFLGISTGNPLYGWGISMRRLISSYVSDLGVYTLGTGASLSVFPTLRGGVYCGILLAKEQEHITLGWNISAGVLYQITPVLRTGASWYYFPPLEWQNSLYGQKVIEQFPSRFRIGFSLTTPRGEWLSEINYTDVSGSLFTINGTNQTVKTSLLTPWDIRIGWRSQLSWLGIPYHIGIFSENLWTTPSPLKQWGITVGFVATGKNTRITLTWLDSYLFSLISRDVQPTERGMISLSYFF